MPKIACVMMQKDETYLLRPWLAYHGYLFGFENLFLIDNGSTDPEVRATLDEFSGKGVKINWEHPTREDYLAKGELIGGTIQALDEKHEYDFLIPLDCDEFILLRTESDIVCAREPVLTYIASLIGEKRVLRVPYQLANHPLNPDIYHRYDFFKIFFPAGTALPIDHGNHIAFDPTGREPRDTRLLHLHFHHKVFDLKVGQARQSWIGGIDLDDRTELETYDGRSVHLKNYFLRGRDDYYRGFLDMPHFYAPRFRALLKELDAPIDLPTEPVADPLQLRITEADASSTDESNGIVVIVPAAPATETAPARFRALRFHEGHYLKANPALAEWAVEPTIHFLLHGFKEGRPLRPAGDARSLSVPDVKAAIATYLARDSGGNSKCLELGSGGGPRPAGWLATDLEPTDNALKLDVTRSFPIGDAAFDYIYARHLIEYLPFSAAGVMLSECFRVLKPGGTIRIVTASIEALFQLIAPGRSAETDRYIRRTTETYMPFAPAPMGSFVFNHFVRGQGREFLYDRATLELVLVRAGFAAVQDRARDVSAHPALRGLESDDRAPEARALDSLILEAVRPIGQNIASG